MLCSKFTPAEMMQRIMEDGSYHSPCFSYTHAGYENVEGRFPDFDWGKSKEDDPVFNYLYHADDLPPTDTIVPFCIGCKYYTGEYPHPREVLG